MAEAPRRPSNQIFDVSEVEAGTIAHAFAKSPKDGADALQLLISKHVKTAVVEYLRRVNGDVLAYIEATREECISRERVELLSSQLKLKMKAMVEAALDPRREPE